MRRILFANKEDWLVPVRERLDPARYEAHFADFLDSAVDFAEYDAVVPLRLSDYRPMWLRPAASFLIPDRRMVQLMHHKRRFNAFLAACGFDDLVPALYDMEVEYPFIYKRHHDQAGKSSRIVFTPEERAAFEAAIDPDDYYRQRYVGGRTEYTTHVLAKQGRIHFDATVMFTFDRDHFVRGVNADAAAVDRIATRFLEVFAAILEALRYTGTCCFNYKLENGRPQIFEVNPRVGGSLRLDLNSYLDAYVRALAS